MADDQKPAPNPVYDRNLKWAKEAKSYLTQLNPEQETQFNTWVQTHNIPYDPAQTADYDMRGFWQALTSGDPRAMTSINPNDQRLHFPDYWKTPYHKSFSNESIYADAAKAPKWNDKDQLVLPDGTVVFDERQEALRQILENQQKAAASAAGQKEEKP